MTRFTGKVVLVTGGGTGIGRSTAEAFAAEGARVVVAGRRAQPLKETVAQIEADGGTARAVTADVCREEDVRGLVAEVVDTFGRLDVACNNAGAPGAGRRLHELSADAWDEIVEANMRTVWLCMKHEIGRMLEQGANGEAAPGNVVNVSSVAGVVGYLHASPYSAAKHGVVGLTRTAAVDYAPDRVRVNAICPGPISTPMLEEARARRGAAADDFYLHNIPLGRLGRPKEVAAAILWMASEEAAYVTGQALSVDGGWTAK